MPASATARLVVGIGSQNPAMFSDPRFLALGVHEARYTAPWDVAVARSQQGALSAAATWLTAAAAANVTPLVSFTGDGTYIPGVSEYRRAVSAFIGRFPQVKRYTPWNEPDWIYLSLSRHPMVAAGYFNALASTCHACQILAGDVYLPAKQLGPWLRAYIKGLHRRPAGWALHNYNDIRSHTTAQLRALIALTRGPLWLDEISGVERRGHWGYPNQSAAAAGRDEQFLFSLPHRFPRISRIYHYLWQESAAAGWDSGLLSASGHIRPAYYVLKHAAR
jgi:hypothetical protein